MDTSFKEFCSKGKKRLYKESGFKDGRYYLMWEAANGSQRDQVLIFATSKGYFMWKKSLYRYD